MGTHPLSAKRDFGAVISKLVNTHAVIAPHVNAMSSRSVEREILLKDDISRSTLRDNIEILITF